MTGCKTCELIESRDRGEAPEWDNILRTPHWDVVHSYDTSLPRWLVLVSRRHLTAIADLNQLAAAELGVLLRQTSIAVQEAVDCEKTYVVQFSKAADHPHVHFHVIPRMRDLAPEHRGPNVFSRFLGRPPGERVPEFRTIEIASKVRTSLTAMRE